MRGIEPCRFWRKEGSRQENGAFKGPEVVARLVWVQINARGLVWLEPREGGRESGGKIGRAHV